MSLLRMVAAAVVLALALTLLLVCSLQLSDTEMASVNQALGGIATAEVRLQSDLLSLRGGLLHDYDPMVADVARLYVCLDRLRSVSDGAADAPIARIADAIAAEDSLGEAFKSANALAQNSFAYFALLSERLARTEGQGDFAARTGALTAAVMQLSQQPTPDVIARTNQQLARVGNGPATADAAADLASLVLHGRLLVEVLPTLDSVAWRLPTLLTLKQRAAIRAIFQQRQKVREHLAEQYRLALFGVAILFLASLVELGRRLTNALLALRERADTEHRLTEISNILIGCQPEDIRHRIRESLQTMGVGTQSVRSYLLVFGDEPDLLIWRRPSVEASPDWPGALLEVVPILSAESGHIFSTATFASTPPPAVMALLRRHGIPHWSCVKVFDQEVFIGILAFERAPEVSAWRSDMASPLRLTGIMISNALHRESEARHRLALEEKVQRAKRLEMVGLFASGIAHNFNNLLGVMLGHAEIVAYWPDAPALVRRHAQHIAETGERAGTLVQRILSYGRRGDRKLRPVALGALAADTVALLAPSLAVRIAFDTRLPGGDVCVTADPTQIQQVLVNLINNAAQASESGTPVVVSIEVADLGKRQTLSHGTLEAGSYVRISVVDQGVGIPADVQAKLFQPFFTTRPAGTGLGLATAAEVIRDLGGAFHLDSLPGQGTSLAFWLPLHGVEGAQDRELAGRGEVIMVAAEKTSRVERAEDALASMGYEPVGLTSAASAIAALRADPERFDLILIGDDLFDMPADDLSVALRAIDSRVPLVFLQTRVDRDGQDARGGLSFDDTLAWPLVQTDLATVMTRLRRSAPERSGVTTELGGAVPQP
ncbi:MAG: DAHL domain-containing protein [Janthinobacterium lividum]